MVIEKTQLGPDLFLYNGKSFAYRIYSINRPGALIKFLDLGSGRLFEVSAYSWLGAY